MMYTAISSPLDNAQSTVAYRKDSPVCTQDKARNQEFFFTSS